MLSHRDTAMTWAGWLYTALLRLYPNEHRHVYGPLMTQLFLDQLRDAQRKGTWHVVALWLRTVIDVMATAPVEHLKGTAMNSSGPLLSWRKALFMLVPVPFFNLVLALVQTAATRQLYLKPWLLDILMALIIGTALVVVMAVWKRTGHVPVWVMPLLGAVVIPMMWYLTFETARRMHLPTIPFFAALWVIAVGLFAYYARLRPVSRPAWATLGAYVVVTIVCMVSNIDLSLPSFSTLALFASSFYLFPVAIGLLLAHKQGVETLLFAMAGIAVSAQYLDLDSQFSIHGDPSVVASYNVLLQALVFVAAPLWMVRARSDRGRLVGVALPILFALTFDMMAGTLYGTISSRLLWWFGVALVQPMLSIGVAYMFYRQAGEQRPHAVDRTENEPTMKMAGEPAI